jgi:hemerythrin-like metal-binding protein
MLPCRQFISTDGEPMNFLTWTENLSVGDGELDKHHKTIIESINKLEMVINKEDQRQVTKKILDELHLYVDYHFSAEEDLFKKTNFPHAQKHIDEHRSFRDRLEKIQRQYDKNDEFTSLEVMDFLINWVTNHIETFDREYIPYIAKKL